MNISNAAKKSGLPIKTVRYYADINLVKEAQRSVKGYREYDEAQIRQLTFVRRAREFGFSVDQCRELLELYRNEKRTSAEVKVIASSKLEGIEQKQRELQLLHDELAHLVQSCRGDNRPDCPIMDYLG